MVGVRNRIYDWTRTAEQALSRTFERVIGVAGPVLGRVAVLFEQGAQPGLAASFNSPGVQRGLGGDAKREQAERAARESWRAEPERDEGRDFSSNRGRSGPER